MDAVKKEHLCPVCGYDCSIANFVPWDNDSPSDEICPSCGIQFGYDDATGGDSKERFYIYRERRKKWIENGMMWYSANNVYKPNNWDPIKQLEQLKKLENL